MDATFLPLDCKLLSQEGLLHCKHLLDSKENSFPGETGYSVPFCLPKLSLNTYRNRRKAFNLTVSHSLRKKEYVCSSGHFTPRLVTALNMPPTYTETSNFSSLEQSSLLVTQDQRLNHLRK